MERAPRSTPGGARPRPWRELARSIWKQVVRQLRRSVADWADPSADPEPPAAPAPTPVVDTIAPPIARPEPASPTVPASPAGPGQAGSETAATAHLRLLMGSATTEIALLRAEIRRRDDDVERLRAALAHVLGRFAEMSGRNHPRHAEAGPTGTGPPPSKVSAPSPDVAVSSSAVTGHPSEVVLPPKDAATDPVESAVPPPEPGETVARATPEPAVEDRSACREIQAASAAFAARPVTGWTLVTVVITTVDWPEELGVAVRSVLTQAYPWWELIVVDDRRPVAPPVTAHGDGRIRVVLGPGTSGAAAGRRGVEAATGQLVTYLDERSVMAKDWLAALAWAAAGSPDADVFVGRSATVTGAALRDGSVAPLTLPNQLGLDRPATELASDLARLCRDGRVLLDPEHSEALAPFTLGHRWPGRWNPFGGGRDERTTPGAASGRPGTIRRLPLLAAVREAVAPAADPGANHPGRTPPLSGLTLVGP